MRSKFPGIIASLLIVLCLLPLPVAADLSSGASPSNPIEIVEMRTETSKTYSLGIDKFRYVGSVGAIHYKDNYSGSYDTWKNIDLSWQGNQVINAPYTLTINPDTYLVFIRDKRTDSTVSIALSSLGGKSISKVAPVYTKGKATFSNIAIDTDLVIEATNESVKFTRILKSSKASTTAVFGISQSGSGLVIRYNAEYDGKMTDKDVKVEATLQDGLLTETIDLSKYPKVTYPLKIDPDIVVATAASADDAEVLRDALTPAWIYQQTRSYCDAGYFSTTYTKLGAGMRFLSIGIPNSATIDASYITFTSANSASGATCNVRFTGEDVDDASAFSSLADFQARRGTIVGGANNNYITTAQVDWDAVGSWTLDVTYDSPSLNTIIQEIVNRAGWAANNDMVIFWDDFDGRSTQGGDIDRTRRPYSYDGSTTKSPELNIDYTAQAPTVTTQAASSVEDTSATLNGNVTALGGGSTSIAERGFDWDVDSGAPYASSWTEVGSYGTGAYTYAAGVYSSGTTYYYRAKAKNNLGEWGYGAEQTFLTKPAAPTNVAATDGTWTTKVVITWTKSTGATDYHVWRDAVDLGAAGDVATFDDTGAGAPTITPGTATATDGSSTTEVTLSIAGESASNGTTHTYKVVASNATGNSDDSATNTGYRGITTLTYQWKVSAADSDAAYSNITGGTTDPYSYTSAPAPTIVGGTGDASDGTSSAFVTLSVSGESATEGAGRWYYCVVSMSGAADADTTHDRGYRGVGALSYVWYRSAADSDAAFSSIAGEGGTTDPYNDINGVVDPDGRWYYATLSASGAASQDSTHNRGYKAAAVPPSVTTTFCSGFTKYEAIVNGIMTDDGTKVCTKYGFDYGLTGAYGSSVEVTRTLTDGTPFWYNLTGLSAGTVYHYRAKAYSADGWGYGSDAQFSTTGSPVQYEYLNTGYDGTSENITGNTWGYQQFTVGTISHTATKVLLYIKKVGSPGTVTLSLRHASGGTPTGNDIVSTTFDGDALSTSYAMYAFEIDETVLEASQQYAIVIRAVAGDASNYINWGLDSGGGLADAVYGYSSNGGLSWISGTPSDALFEIWGNPAIDVIEAKVFTSYLATGDWLIIANTSNVYEPYYPDQDPQTIFQLQLIDGTTIKGANTVKAWDKQPLAIYLSPATAATMTWGSGYKVRMQSLASATVYQEYALLSADWNAGSMLFLDGYIRNLASQYETYYETTFLTTGSSGALVLNEEGATMFMRGISALEKARPNLFYASFGASIPEDVSHTLYAPDPSTAMGSDIYGRFSEAATLLDTDTTNIIGWMLIAFALLIGFGCASMGFGGAGLVIGLVISSGAGFVFGGIPIAVIGAVGFIAIFLIVIYLAKMIFQ